MDPLARIRTFPKAPAPNDDISAIRGNVSSEHKQLNANCLAYHIGGAGSKVFANDLLKDMKLVEVHVRQKRPGVGGEAKGTERWECETICEIEVKQDMLNVHGTVAGAVFVHVFDTCTFSSLFGLGFAVNMDPSGVSSSMDIRWHSPATLGMTLSIISTSLTIKGRISASRAEAYDKETGSLIASATHSISPLASRLLQDKGVQAKL